VRIGWRRTHGARTGTATAAGVAVAIAAAMAVGLPAAAGPASATATGARPAAVAWTPCGGVFQCATVQVPLDYGRPTAGSIGIALIRRPASDPARRIGSLFLNPGGPGASGLDAVRRGSAFFISPQVRAHFDIVGFDPRGIGASSGISCFRSAQEFEEFWGDLPPIPLVPYTNAQVQPYIARTADYSRLCGQRNRAILPHMSTVDVARDLDLLRAAVGEQTLTYLGFSYGSYIGQVYANLFPNRVRAITLDGVLDPELWANHPLLSATESAHGGEVTLDAFADACAQAGAACVFGNGDGATSIRQRINAILASIRSAPMPAPNADPPGTLDYPLANLAILLNLYDTFFWPTFAAGLEQAEAGDASILLDFIRLFMAPPGEYDPAADTFTAVFCTDGTFPFAPDTLPAAVRLAEQIAPTFSAYWVYGALPCTTWPARVDDRYAGPWNRQTSAPILLVNTRADPATPLSGAARAKRRLADARLVTLDGLGHTTAAHPSACIQQVIDRYFIDLVAPPDGMHCAPDAGPFDVASAQTRTTNPSARPWLPRIPAQR